MRCTVALFGEAEKGPFETPHFLKDLPDLMDRLGTPPSESEGLFFAIQALLFKREIIYFRVANEGFSSKDYLNGLDILKCSHFQKKLHAICMPGVGDPKILKVTKLICQLHNTHLIVSEKDLFDFLTGL